MRSDRLGRETPERHGRPPAGRRPRRPHHARRALLHLLDLTIEEGRELVAAGSIPDDIGDDWLARAYLTAELVPPPKNPRHETYLTQVRRASMAFDAEVAVQRVLRRLQRARAELARAALG